MFLGDETVSCVCALSAPRWVVAKRGGAGFCTVLQHGSLGGADHEIPHPLTVRESALVGGFLLPAVRGRALCAAALWESGAARRYAIPAILLIIGLLFVVQKLVVTQREEIRLAMGVFVSAMVREDSSAIEDALARDYAGEGMDREAFTKYLGALMEVLDIRDTRFMRCDMDMGDDSAVMALTVRATVSIRGRIGQLHWGSWRIAWLREVGGWKIVSVQPLSVDGQPVHTLQALGGYLP